MEIVGTRVIVEGRVQGVWFRESTRRMAEGLGVTGWVRNLEDGRVEAHFEGPAEKVAEAVAWSAQGPEHALVTDVHVFDETPGGFTEFAIRPTRQQ